MSSLEKENTKLSKDKQLSERQIMEQAGFEARDLTVDFRKMGKASKHVAFQDKIFSFQMIFHAC